MDVRIQYGLMYLAVKQEAVKRGRKESIGPCTHTPYRNILNPYARIDSTTGPE
jgi:hypothetical protein